MKILTLLICLGLGTLFILKTDAIERTTGKIGWAERNLGGAGTNSFYKLLGVAIIIFGFLVATGFIDNTIGAFFRGQASNVER